MNLLDISIAPNSAIDWPAIQEIFPVWQDLAACPQDPSYHAEGDVWTHTKMVCEAMVQLDGYAEASPARRQILLLAALLHDIGKPACTRLEGDRLTSKGHSKRGEIDARILLWKAGCPFEIREAICRLIAVHQLPFMVMAKSANPAFVAHKLSHELCIHELCLLAESDARGRRTVPVSDWQSTLDNVALFRLLAEEETCLHQPYLVADDYTGFRYFRTEGSVPAMYPLHREPGSRVIVMSGLPASGKNTWLAANHPDLPVMSFDDAREELGIKAGAKDVGRAVHQVTDQAKALLRKKQDFAFNATHLSQDMRNKTLDLLYSYHADVEIVYLEVPASELFKRNSRRDSTLDNKSIERMLFKWEPPLPTEAPAVRYLVDEVLKPKKRLQA